MERQNKGYFVKLENGIGVYLSAFWLNEKCRVDWIR